MTAVAIVGAKILRSRRLLTSPPSSSHPTHGAVSGAEGLGLRRNCLVTLSTSPERRIRGEHMLARQAQAPDQDRIDHAPHGATQCRPADPSRLHVDISSTQVTVSRTHLHTVCRGSGSEELVQQRSTATGQPASHPDPTPPDLLTSACPSIAPRCPELWSRGSARQHSQVAGS